MGCWAVELTVGLGEMVWLCHSYRLRHLACQVLAVDLQGPCAQKDFWGAENEFSHPANGHTLHFLGGSPFISVVAQEVYTFFGWSLAK